MTVSIDHNEICAVEYMSGIEFMHFSNIAKKNVNVNIFIVKYSSDDSSTIKLVAD